MSMKAVAARSALWSAAETWGVRGVSALVFLLLARLLDASAFGVMALAGVSAAFGAGGVVPVPVSIAVCGEPVALSVTVNVAV